MYSEEFLIIALVFALLGCTISVIAWISAIEKNRKGEQFNQPLQSFWVLAMALTVMNSIVVGLLLVHIGKGTVGHLARQLTREVYLTRVPVSGEAGFRAQVQFIYKDGELEKIELMPNSTQKIE